MCIFEKDESVRVCFAIDRLVGGVESVIGGQSSGCAGKSKADEQPGRRLLGGRFSKLSGMLLWLFRVRWWSVYWSVGDSALGLIANDEARHPSSMMIIIRVPIVSGASSLVVAMTYHTLPSDRVT